MNLAQPLVNVAAHLFQSELAPDKYYVISSTGEVCTISYTTLQTTQSSPVIEIWHFALQGRKRKEFGGNKCFKQGIQIFDTHTQLSLIMYYY